jgi:ATP-dependent DNA helicase RecG
MTLHFDTNRKGKTDANKKDASRMDASQIDASQMLVQYVKGVGPKLGDLLRKRGIVTARDLLEYYPRTYEDRRAVRHIQSLVPDQLVSIKAQILKIRSIPMGKSNRRMWEILVGDSTGRIACKFFRVPYKGYFERFQPLQEVRVIGKVTNYRGSVQFHHPEIHPIQENEENENAIVPIYTEIETLTSAKIGRLIRVAMVHQVPELLPPSLLNKFNLMGVSQALHEVHEPPLEQGDLFLKYQSPAQRRLIFDEFLLLELHMAMKKAGVEKERSTPIRCPGFWCEKLKRSLPFQLTDAQLRAWREIHQDLEKPHPMHRLVQGDVGSGKTLVAMLAAVYAAEAKIQTALMVPTEILAEQHFQNAVRLLTGIGVKVAMLTSQCKGKERVELLTRLEGGDIHLLIGTHALIQDDVKFQSLGLVIVDEQHRFGVEQRNKLKHKGLSPHFLVMTATPIPRTLAMTVYGDLDVSVIDELPKGRQPIITRKTFDSKRPQVMGFVRDQLEQGRQAYIVYPLIEESETLDLKNALEEHEKIKKEFADFNVGLLHGRMKTSEKDEVMNQFRAGTIHVLVSTTVIEVGVDVPNANIMVIEHAERFGLSQLHQLRGRVGRGEHKSYCVLMLGYALSEEGRQRADIMESTSDGFKVAEADLEMRGPGEFLGTRQSGLPGFKLANLVRDMVILQEARSAAFSLVASDPDMKKPEHASLIKLLRSRLDNWVG